MSALRKAWLRPGAILLWLSPLGAIALFGVTLRHPELNEPFFVHSAYYVLLTLVLVYGLVQVACLVEDDWSPRTWLRQHWPGLLVSLMLTGVVVLAIEPAFRVLSDEANLVGVSKNLFFRKTANFAVTGKWYFENYWNLAETVDRRPTLFPFLVSLLHVVRGYHHENAFHLNALLFGPFVFCCYRLAKAIAGEWVGLSTAILVAASPVALVSVRSAGYDFLSAFLLLLVIKAFFDYVTHRSAARLALLTIYMCMLSHVRLEGGGLFVVAAAVLLALRLVRWEQILRYGFVYALAPWFLVMRYWQSIAKARDAEQPLSAALFTRADFRTNVADYWGTLRTPFDVSGPHAPVVILLGTMGLLFIVVRLIRAWRSRSLAPAMGQFSVLVAALVGIEIFVSFAYSWGKPLHPASARLYVWLDTLLAFTAAWLLTNLGRRLSVSWAMLGSRVDLPASLPVCVGVFALYMSSAVEARFVNALVLTRQAAATWRFFEKQGDKNIVIVTDRPGLYTIMNYGALDIATPPEGPLFELSRHLYQDLYVIQEIGLDSHKPLPGFDGWSNVPKETVLEFQNADNAAIRVVRVKH